MEDEIEKSLGYPYDIPCAWLAHDLDQAVAVFMTEGRGLIPIESLVLPLDIRRMWEEIERLTQIRDSAQASPFLKRGLHSYSWDSGLKYTRCGLPAGSPLTLHELDPALRSAAAWVPLETRFAEVVEISSRSMPRGICVLG